MKGILTKLLLLMMLISLAAIGVVLVQSLAPSERALNEAEYVLNIESLKPGDLQIQIIAGRQLFVLKPNTEQLASIDYMDNHVWNKNKDSYLEESGVFIYWGHSTKFDRPLEHHSVKETVPPGWWEERKWMGGYWHPWDEVSYDYAGRTISTYEHTYNGYTAEYPNLYVPNIRYVGDKLLISLF